MAILAKKFRGVWHYGVITGVVTEWVLEDYGGATQWRAVFEDGDTADLLRSEVVEAMAAAQERPLVDADREARLVTVHEGDDLFALQINRMKAHRLYREPNPNKKLISITVIIMPEGVSARAPRIPLPPVFSGQTKGWRRWRHQMEAYCNATGMKQAMMM
eukprot:jgi/Tetstr1/456669/TSEL_043370.t1